MFEDKVDDGSAWQVWHLQTSGMSSTLELMGCPGLLALSKLLKGWLERSEKTKAMGAFI